jgi:hypothetical protein
MLIVAPVAGDPKATQGSSTQFRPAGDDAQEYP